MHFWGPILSPWLGDEAGYGCTGPPAYVAWRAGTTTRRRSRLHPSVRDWKYDYWIARYRGPGFLDSAPRPPLSPILPSASCLLSQSSFVSLVELTDGGGGRETKSYDGEKAWPSITHSILPGPSTLQLFIEAINKLVMDEQRERGVDVT